MALFPGAPNLLRNYPRAFGLTLLGNVVNAAWNFLFPGPQWGVFIEGTATPAVTVSSVLAVDAAGDSRTSDYPLQTGSFTTYNKVRTPNVFRITITRDGFESDRQELLQWLVDNLDQPTVYDVVCPEFRWPSVTLVSYRITRTAQSGAGMILAECIFQQIRQLPVVYSNSTIASPENQSSTPTARVNAVPDADPITPGGPIAWQ